MQEEPIGGSKMKTNLCIPIRLMKSSNNKYSCTKTKPLISPMTLLERFREAVLRLIMLSAVSTHKSTANQQSRSTDHHVQQYTYCSYDSHHSEAVADCIEFIKKKASPDDDDDGDNRGSCTSSSNVDDPVDLEAIIPVDHIYV